MAFTADTIQYPTTSPTETVTFNITSRVSKNRQVQKNFEQGTIGGGAISESPGISILKLSFDFELISNGATSALAAWDTLDDLMADHNDEDVRLTLNSTNTISGSEVDQYQTFDGKITGLSAVQQDTDRVTGSMKFSVISKGAITNA